MSLPLPPPTAEQLASAPELASLELLDRACDTASRALFATYPELQNPDLLVDPGVPPQLLLVAAILFAVRPLGDAVRRYRVHLEHLAQIRLDELDDIPF